MASPREKPVGIFDSGIGGLTVLASVRRRLPAESIVYLGDTARVPYGNKSAETVVRYALECAEFLAERDAKALVVACNTASAYALPELRSRFKIPVLGVVEPGAAAALAVTKRRAVGVIGTSGTISSNAYGSVLKRLDPGCRVVSSSCPLFVPLVEEGWIDGEVAEAAARIYLGGMREEGIDTLILGCTHYPLLAGTIQAAVGDGVKLVDSAETTAQALEEMLRNSGIEAPDGARPESRIYATDMPARFEAIAHRFLSGDLPPVARVDL